MGGFLGAVELLAPRSTYPLGFHHAARITDQRLALVGDAAHGIHPIAGQGLNLGFRDAAALAQVLVEGARLGLDLGDAQLLARYERWRSLDTLMVGDGDRRPDPALRHPGQAASAVRRFGMALTGRIGPLKDRLMAEARGTSGDLPLLLRGLADLDYCSVWLASAPPGAMRWNCMNWTSRSARSAASALRAAPASSRRRAARSGRCR